MAMTDKTDGVLAVLERMRVQADYGRCADSDLAAKEAIRHIDEDRAALSAVAELLAADEEYDAALSDCRNLDKVVTPEMEARLELAETRRAAAIRAMRGES
jgi:hypothetical protein